MVTALVHAEDVAAGVCGVGVVMANDGSGDAGAVAFVLFDACSQASGKFSAYRGCSTSTGQVGALVGIRDVVVEVRHPVLGC